MSQLEQGHEGQSLNLTMQVSLAVENLVRIIAFPTSQDTSLFCVFVQKSS